MNTLRKTASPKGIELLVFACLLWEEKIYVHFTSLLPYGGILRKNKEFLVCLHCLDYDSDNHVFYEKSKHDAIFFFSIWLFSWRGCLRMRFLFILMFKSITAGVLVKIFSDFISLNNNNHSFLCEKFYEGKCCNELEISDMLCFVHAFGLSFFTISSIHLQGGKMYKLIMWPNECFLSHFI